ncbi:DUF4062 domain-containing protein [Acidisoma silvae]|uniref:DUF4062 domain-containing protein n=1 Tax=Acidisoma silvae TaxID=2802396 RepID=A0A963YV48_9PROT|nr:DUF4062 domain-containing protein [Acidisoma silvae]MCB8877618.1 DUF4062 domain-containing protein [Acidisoma silvae]
MTSDKRKYQIFVSSTFKDLVDERQDTIRNVLDLGHIPAGMELFPAADTDQFSYIKKIIDECDYYVLIVGGRYGSVSDDGISFTELEYDYAVSQGLTVLAFIHGEPGEISLNKSELDNARQIQLTSFRKKVSSGRLVQFWTNREQLESRVLKSLSRAFIDSPRMGWIRGDAAASSDLLSQINFIRNEKDELLNKVSLWKACSSQSLTASLHFQTSQLSA